MRKQWTIAGMLTMGLAAGCGGSQQPTGDVTLDPPSKGFQLAVPPYSVPDGTEVQACYFFKVPDLNNGQPFFVDKIEIAQNPGSHHMNLFRIGTIVQPNPMNPNAGLAPPNPNGMPGDPNNLGSVVSMNGKGPCFYSSNWADWPLVVNTQATQNPNDPPYTLTLPKPASGPVGWKFSPGEVLMVQSHYVNATTQKTPGRGKVLANFDQMADATNAQELGTIFATHQSIAICEDNPTPSYTGYCHINNPSTPLTIVAANGHFHSRGRDFTICPWDGTSTDACTTTKFYESKVWDEPPMATGLDIAVPAGGGIDWTCTYQWEPSPACADGCSCLTPPKPGAPTGTCCYGFGGVVETSEHCNAFVYYYPKIDNADINCK